MTSPFEAPIKPKKPTAETTERDTADSEKPDLQELPPPTPGQNHSRGHHSLASRGKDLSYDTSYSETTEVNGIEIYIGWERKYGCYSIIFPAIQFGEAAISAGVPDQLINIDEDPEIAKLVFAFAKITAETEPDVLLLYKKVEQYKNELLTERE